LRSSAARESVHYPNINNAAAALENKGSASIEAQHIHPTSRYRDQFPSFLERLQRQQAHPISPTFDNK
jgi:hypothetical protein